MRKSAYLVSVIAASILAPVSGRAADPEIHVLTPTSALKWSYKGHAEQVTTVGDLKVGDFIEVKIPAGPIHHGFSAIKIDPKDPKSITPIEDVVLKCGETDNAKPHAVLKEVECGEVGSEYGILFSGTLKLEVLSSFKDDVPFWCVQHTRIMQGVLKLQPPAAAPKSSRTRRSPHAE